MVSQPVAQKLLVEDHHLSALYLKLKNLDDLDGLLFLSLCFTAFHGLIIWSNKLSYMHESMESSEAKGEKKEAIQVIQVF